jgi:hypothetical protein
MDAQQPICGQQQDDWHGLALQVDLLPLSLETEIAYGKLAGVPLILEASWDGDITPDEMAAIFQMVQLHESLVEIGRLLGSLFGPSRYNWATDGGTVRQWCDAAAGVTVTSSCAQNSHWLAIRIAPAGIASCRGAGWHAMQRLLDGLRMLGRAADVAILGAPSSSPMASWPVAQQRAEVWHDRTCH